MTTLLHCVFDYAPNDLAWSEILAALYARLPADVRIIPTSIDKFDTIGTGFAVGQLGLAQPPARPVRTFIFANTAPRKDRRSARTNNAGEGLLWGRLKNGVEVIAVNSGNTLSFVQNDLDLLYTTIAPDRGSQFRSRDFFPQVVCAAIAGETEILVRNLNINSVVPVVPESVVGYRDRDFGNLKTTLRAGHTLLSELVPGERVKATIGNKVRTATVATGSFNVKEGDLAFAPGSSGFESRFWELFKRGGSAWEEFDCPPNGTAILIEKDARQNRRRTTAKGTTAK